MIKVFNRNTGKYEIENVAGRRMLDFLYTNRVGRISLETLVKRKIYSSVMGFACNTRVSRKMIPGFVQKFDIDISQCKNDLSSFKSFNQFFIREMKPEARSFSPELKTLASPGDGRLKAWMNIDIKKLVQIKGFTYSLEELLTNKELADKYDKGTCIILRLAPVDYHRFHFFDSGICSRSTRIKGNYYSVNPVALESIAGVFCRNKREYSIFHSDNFGDVLYVEVGATSVGSIVQTYTPESPVSRGDEKGYFKFGGSTVVLFFEKDKIKIDEDILHLTETGLETKVIAGETIGSGLKT